MTQRTLDKKKIARQDFVDNEIFDLIRKILPEKNTIDWDIEMIGTIREAIREQVVNQKKIMNEQQFYPYLS